MLEFLYSQLPFLIFMGGASFFVFGMTALIFHLDKKERAAKNPPKLTLTFL